jgi:hypothetical protein
MQLWRRRRRQRRQQGEAAWQGRMLRLNRLKVLRSLCRSNAAQGSSTAAAAAAAERHSGAAAVAAAAAAATAAGTATGSSGAERRRRRRRRRLRQQQQQQPQPPHQHPACDREAATTTENRAEPPPAARQAGLVGGWAAVSRVTGPARTVCATPHARYLHPSPSGSDRAPSAAAVVGQGRGAVGLGPTVSARATWNGPTVVVRQAREQWRSPPGSARRPGPK